jgi:hypothetical protein
VADVINCQKISRLMWTEQYKLLLRVTDLVKKLCEERFDNNVQSSRILIGRSGRRLTGLCA